MSEEFLVTVTLPGTPEHFTRSCSSAVSVGRAPESDIQLVHPLVSRKHAEIDLRDDASFSVRDCGSRNGTVVNDVLLQDAERSVLPPVVLQIGPYVLQLTPASAVAEDTLRAKPAAPLHRVALDSGLHVLLVDGKPAIEGLIGLEYKLMELLTAADGRLVANQAIGDALWGANAWDAYMLHNLVRRVRRKLEDKSLAGDELIVSVPGGGYRVS